jgi:acyl-CoA thioester hydrolase
MDDENTVVVKKKIRVMTYEIDFAGIVSNQVYPRWLEDMRMEILQKFGDLREMMSSGTLPVLAHMEIDFKRPLKLLDEVDARMWVEEMGDTRWVIKAEFRKGDQLCTRAVQWGVFVDTRTMRPCSAPESFPRLSKGSSKAS